MHICWRWRWRCGALATLDQGLAELVGQDERDGVEVIRFDMRFGD